MRCPKVSPSRLKTYKPCEFKYFLTYEWGWGDELFQYTFASAFGTAVHNTLEEYALVAGDLDYKVEFARQIQQENPFLEDMTSAPSKARAAFFKDKKCESCSFFDVKKARCKIVDQHVEHFEGCPKKLYEDGIVMIETAIDRYGEYYHTGIKDDVTNPDGRVVGAEVPAQITWGLGEDGNEIVMNGYIDLVVEYDSETLLIVDYKTGFSCPTHDEFIKDLQPRMYSYAARKMFPEYKYYWVQFDYFRGVPLEYTFTSHDDEKTRQEVVSLYNTIRGARKIQRRSYDKICKYLCNRDLCNQKWAELKAGVDGKNPEFDPDAR